MDGTNYSNGFHTIPEEDQNGYHHERMDSNGASGSDYGHTNGYNGYNGSAMGSTAGSIADTDRGTDEELDDFNEEEDQESFSALYRLVNEESPPPEMPQPKRKTSVASVEARERARRASRDLKREKNDTSGGGRRSLKREHLIIKWILMVTHVNKDSSLDFADWIKDGSILSKIMTTLCFNSIERDQWSSFGCSPEDQKVKDVRNQILHYGVDQKYLFRLEDVTKKMNTPKVVRCLEEVAKLSAAETHIKYDTLLSNKLYT